MLRDDYKQESGLTFSTAGIYIHGLCFGHGQSIFLLTLSHFFL